MRTWFLRGLRRGIVTTHYPARPEPSVAALRTPPTFHPELLTAALAEALAAVCPSAALQLEDGWLSYDVGACTACGRCYAVAGPAAAPSGEIELAATRRAHQVKRISIGGGDDELI